MRITFAGYYNDKHNDPNVVDYRNNNYTPVRRGYEKRQEMWVVVGAKQEEFFKDRYPQYPVAVDTCMRDGITHYIHHVDDMPGDEWLMLAEYNPTLQFVKPSTEEQWKATCKVPNHT